VVDDAGGHEQRGLERGVVDDVEHAGDQASGVSSPSSSVIRPRWLIVE
jgi:hypothetical protein